jgi:hypothetical protein
MERGADRSGRAAECARPWGADVIGVVLADGQVVDGATPVSEGAGSGDHNLAVTEPVEVIADSQATGRGPGAARQIVEQMAQELSMPPLLVHSSDRRLAEHAVSGRRIHT